MIPRKRDHDARSRRGKCGIFALVFASSLSVSSGAEVVSPVPRSLVRWGSGAADTRLLESVPASIAVGGYYEASVLLLDARGNVRGVGANGAFCTISPGYPPCAVGYVGQSDPPADLPPVAAVAAGGSHSLALLIGGNVRAWGANNAGQCNVPTSLREGGSWRAASIAAGIFHSLACYGTNGAVAAWGSNTYGQVTVPSGLSGVTAVSAGAFTSAALRFDGSLRCWGNGASVPADLGLVAAIACGGDHFVARKPDGSVRAWGNNASGQCNIPEGIGPVIQIAAGNSFTALLSVEGAVHLVGQSQLTPSLPLDLGPARTIAASGAVLAVAEATGGVRIIDGKDGSSPMSGPSSVRAYHSGYNFGVGVDASGRLFANGNPTPLIPAGLGLLRALSAEEYVAAFVSDSGAVHVSLSPSHTMGESGLLLTQVPAGIGPVIDVDVSGAHVMALEAQGSVRCWGRNIAGECDVPTSVSGIRSIDAVVGASMAVGADGRLHVWGTWGPGAPPVDLGFATKGELGAAHGVALQVDGIVRCWGSNGYGQCSTPTGIGPCSDIAAGRFHTVALTTSGQVRCWGAVYPGGGDPVDYGQTRIPKHATFGTGLVSDVRLWTGLWVSPPCAGDLSGNGQVGGEDLGLLLGAWDVNGVDAPTFIMDGRLDPSARLVATAGGRSIWARISGAQLYVATQDAGEGDDVFIAIADVVPGPMQPAWWAKAGTVARWRYTLCDENDSQYCGWINSSGSPTFVGSARCATGVNGGVLEGVIDLGQIFGYLPAGISLAAVAYATPDGGALRAETQVPPSINGDGNLDAFEYVTVETCSLRGWGCDDLSSYDLNGDGEINGQDLGVLLGSWGLCSP